MEKKGDSYKIIVRTNLCDRSITLCIWVNALLAPNRQCADLLKYVYITKSGSSKWIHHFQFLSIKPVKVLYLSRSASCNFPFSLAFERPVLSPSLTIILWSWKLWNFFLQSKLLFLEWSDSFRKESFIISLLHVIDKICFFILLFP